jgi:site-specific recombinase XerD
MATVTFTLNKPFDATGKPKTTPVAVLARVYISRDKRFSLTTKESILPKYWDTEKQRAKSHMTGSVEFNLSLSNIEKDVLQLWRENKTLSIEALQERAKNIVAHGAASPAQKKTNDLEEFIEGFIEKCREGKINRSAGTIQIYEVTLAHLREFVKEYNHELRFDAITLDFYDDFCEWSWETKEHSDTTLGKHIKTLKTFMQEAFEQDLHRNMTFQKKRFAKPEGKTNSVYLTEAEIQQIAECDLPAHLLACRDSFVFACWVGLRYSDFSRIRPEHIAHDKIRIITKKTGEEVVIPFHPVAREIYRKYNNSLPELDSNPEFNWKLKEIAKAAKLTDKVQRLRTQRGQTEVEYVDKWEMITTHTARRSFATNCYKMGIPTRSIMAITGHKTEKAFTKYIRLSKEEHASIVMDVFAKQVVLKTA